MTKTPRILCFGHSHMAAVQRAYRDNFNSGEWNFDMNFLRLQADEYQPNFVDVAGGERKLNDLIGRHIRHKSVARPADAVVGFVYGNEVNSMAMLRFQPDFDFHFPGDETPVMPDAEVVPFGAIRDMIRFRIEDRISPYVAAARSGYEGKVCIVPPPPPIADEAHIRAHPGGFKAGMEARGISPAPLRLKLWRLYRDILREQVEAAGGQLLDVPPTASDADGFLKNDYWHWHPTQGNFVYGELMIRHILSALFAVSPERNAA
ncbi:MAG: hypothetical protein ACPGVA_05305 [Pikeienuella sp.]